MEQNEPNNTALRLEELSKSAFEIADHQPDITGWDILDSAGYDIGEVHDLIFDKETRKVRYIVSNVHFEVEENSRLVLIPIGIVTLHEKEDEVIISELSASYLPTLPVYKTGTVISPAEELAIRYAFLGKKGLETSTEDPYVNHQADFYAHEHFNENNFRRRLGHDRDTTSEEHQL